ncbi:ATP-dependent DNA ligase [Candidatus Thorarchaeota archaeon]|nr:MAG: ATP-dependent DNA ligase [Candidatus Thorarchaeota archaeon]
MKIDGQNIDISNREKVFFPDSGFTKGDVIDYYMSVADNILPHLKNHGISMQRFPDGLAGEGFYNKDAPDYFPDWLETIEFPKEDEGSFNAPVVQSKAALAYLVNQAVLTPHLYLSRIDDLQFPDRLVFDLDPPKDTKEFDAVRDAALDIRDILEELDLKGWIQTTGSMGFHIHVPILREFEFDEVRQFARDVAFFVTSKHEERYTIKQREEKRNGRIFIDYFRNSYGATSVAPYAVRARSGAPVAAPVDWTEVKEAATPRDWSIENMPNRMAQKEDPWADMARHARSIKKRRQKLTDMLDQK